MRIFWWIVIIFIVINLLLWFGGPRLFLAFQDFFLPYSGKWQAVYMSNGDIFVGQIRASTPQVIKLANSYALKISKTDQSEGVTPTLKVSSGAIGGLSLIKWGNFQPLKSAGQLYLTRSSVLLWETLADDSEVVKQIKAALK